MTKDITMESATSPLALPDQLDPHDLHRLFAESEYGDRLSEAIRYEGYKPETVSNQEWERMFGADVNNLRHMPLTYGLTRSFLRHCAEPHEAWSGPIPPEAQFSPQETERMREGAMIHDWGESVTGDVLWHLKTEEDEEAESLAFKQLLEEIAGSNPALKDRLSDIVAEVVEDRTSKLGKAFNAVERVGYVRTGTRAYELLKADLENPELETRLNWLTHNVLANQISALVDYGETYPAIDEFLLCNRQRISQAFLGVNQAKAREYYDGDHTKYESRFRDSRAAYFARYVPLGLSD